MENAAQVQVGLAEIFEAHAAMEQAHGRRVHAAEGLKDAKEALKTAKAEKDAADGDFEQARNRVLELVGRSRQEQQAAGTQGPADAPGWIDERTRPGRRFTLAGSDDRVEFRGIEAGKVKVHWVNGLLAGESFFPAGDITVEQWNAEYAPKVEGCTDVVGEEGAGVREEGAVNGEEPAQAEAPAAAAAENQQPAIPQAPDDSWRVVKLMDLKGPDIRPSVLKALEDHEPPIRTVGELADWTAIKGQFWGKDIKGVGPAAQVSIECSLEAFWRRRKA